MARKITHTLLADKELKEFIVGVGVGGSLSKFEYVAHDLDMVIFHNGRLQDTEGFIPSVAAPAPEDDMHLSAIGMLLPDRVAQRVVAIRDGVPTNLVLLDQKAFWDCRYVGSLPDRYKTMFVRHHGSIHFFREEEARGALGMCLDSLRTTSIVTINNTLCELIRMNHDCHNLNCQPSIDRRKWMNALRERRKRAPWGCPLPWVE
jgi:hypothetical protein